MSSPTRPPPLPGGGLAGVKPRSLCSYPGFPSRSPLEEDLALLRKKTPASRYVMYDSIFRALEALLRAMTQTSQVPTSKSLLHMCLRKMPQYISELEEWDQKEAEENGTRSAIESSKATFEVYGELENMGASGSWRHLRTVVRSHGVKIVKDAISDGLFDPSFSRLLVKLCTSLNAYAEAEELSGVLACQQISAQSEAGPIVVSTEAATPLLAVIRLAEESGRTSFLFRQVNDLLSAGRLPEHWLSSNDLGVVWLMAARAITSTSSCDDALSLATTYCKLLCVGGAWTSRSPLPANIADEIGRSSHRTFVSMLGAIGAMLMLGQESLSRTVNDTAGDMVRTVAKRWVFVIQACLAETKSSRREEVKKRRFLLDLTLFLSIIDMESIGATDSDAIPARIEKTWGAALDESRQRQLYDEATALIAALACCCGRSSLTPPRTYLNTLCDRMATLHLPNDLFKHMRSDSAFLLADRTNDLRDLAFAERLEARRTPARARPLAAQRPTTDQAPRAGYRWEAGISEWVTVTPAATQSKRVSSSRRRSTDSGIALGSDTRSRRPPTTTRPGRAARAEATPSSDCETDSGGDQDPPSHRESDDGACGSSGDEDHHSSSSSSAQPRRRRRPNTRQGTRKAGVARRTSGGGGLLSLVPDDELCLEWSGGTAALLGLPGSNAKRSSLRGPTAPQVKPIMVSRRSSSYIASHSDDDDELGL